MKRALAGEVLEIYGDGSQTRDFIYVGDLTRAICLCLGAESVGGEVFQIATSKETTVSQLAEMLRPILCEAGAPPVDLRCAPPRAGEVLRNYSDTSKAHRRLGWRPEVSLEDGLGKTVDWYVRRDNLSALPDPK